MLFIAHIQLFHGKQLTEPVWGQLPELLGDGHITKMRLQELSSDVVDVVKAVVQREEPDANAVFCSDAALQELAAEGLEVCHEEQVGGLHHVLDSVFTQRDLCECDI